MSSPRPERKSALAIGCAAHVVQDGLTATVYVLLPILAQAFGLSYAQVGLFKGAKSLAQAALEMGSGLMSERIGECRVLVFGLLLSGLGYGALAAAPDAVLVLACLFVIGAGTAFQHAPASALIISAYPVDGRRGPLGIYNSSGDAGKLAFTGAFSLLIGAGLAWQGISLIYGAAAILAALAIALAGQSFDRKRRQQAAADDAVDAAGDGSGTGWGILDWRSFSTLLLVVFLDTMVQAGALVFVAFLMLAKGLPLALATLATVVLLAGGIFGKAGCGYLADRIGVRPAFVVIQALTAIGLLLVIAVPGWVAFALLFPLGVVVQGSTSITYGFAADLIHPRRMARGYALLYSSASFSSVVGPYVFGVAADAFGIEAAMIAMAVTGLLAVPPLAILPSLFRQTAKAA